MREEIQNCMHEMKRRLTKKTLHQLKEQKTEIIHLRLMQNISNEPLMLKATGIPRASSEIFSQLHHHPVRFCINRKAINKKKRFFCNNYGNLF